MQKNIYLITIDAGSTWSFTVLWKDVEGAPVVMTDYTARFQVRRKAGAVADLTLDATAGIAITPADGRLDLQASAAQTAGLSGDYVYALEVTSPGGIVTTLIRGNFVALPDLVSND